MKKYNLKSNTIRILSCGMLSLITIFEAQAKVKLPAMFTDNMVLQQKDNAPVWGIADPGKSVTIITSWNNKKYVVTANANGNWKATLKTPAASLTPYTITFSDGDVVTLNNVLIGEVWVCSGQSNMEMPLEGWGKILNYKEEIGKANYPNIRLLHFEKNTSLAPLKDAKIDNGGWQTCSPQTIADFSAVAYFFAKDITDSKNIPIGLISTNWGGTVAEAWTSGSSLKKMPDFAPIVEQMENVKDMDQLKKDFQQKQAAWQQETFTKDAGFSQSKAIWAAADLNTLSWKTMAVPGYWENAGLTNYDGIVWYRKKIDIPAGWAGKALQLSLGPVDDNDITYFNGVEIGRTEGFNVPRNYTIPASLVHEGDNIITTRVYDSGGEGGFYGDADKMFITDGGNEKISLKGEWSYNPSLNFKDMPAKPQNIFDGPNHPTLLYNAMIAPLVPYAIRGAIWYQGESNADRAKQYQALFPLMIQDWRKQWGRGDFPFYFVQLANYMSVKDQPAESNWAELREAQLKTLSLPATGMASAIDIGDAKDIHPKNKQEVGRRLALIARAQVYGEKIPYSGPLYKSSKIEGNKIRLSFTQTNEGLKTNDGKALRGFSIAGADGKYYWADAVIAGNDVIVSAKEVTSPVAVRYDWADNPVGNLYNGAGLPASPFRTKE